MGRLVLFAAIAALLWPAQVPQPQSQAQAPTFRGRLDVIRTDVAVIDNRTGRPVAGLTERDFTILENGVRQTISSFVDDAEGTEAADPHTRRVFLFSLPIGPAAEGPYKVYDGVAQFIRERLRPQDLVGLFVFTRMVLPTSDHERIAAMVDRLKQPMPLEFLVLQSGLRRGVADASDFSPALERYVDEKLEPGGAASGVFQDATAYLLNTAEYRTNVEADIRVQAWKWRLAGNAVLKAAAGIESLRRIEGEKHLILIGVGFSPPVTFTNEGIGLRYRSAADDRRMAARANDAGVAIDIVQTSGTGSGTLSFAIMSNANLSEESGGQFSSLRVAAQQLARIDEASRRGYILGYVPATPELDGKYRQITVTVNRKDVTVVYRRGYTANVAPEPVNAQQLYERSRVLDAAAGYLHLTDILVQAKATRLGSATNRQVRVDVTIDVSKLPLVETPGRWEGDIDMLIVCGDAKQNVVGVLDQRMHLNMNQTMRDQALAGGVPYSTTIPVSGPVAFVKAIVYHAGTDRLGSSTVVMK